MEYLKFGDTEIAVPTTFTIDKKKIMSDNAGLSSTCKYVGDVKGLQTTLHIEWANLKPQEVAIINEYVLNVQDADFPVTYLDETFNMVTVRLGQRVQHTSSGVGIRKDSFARCFPLTFMPIPVQVR